jgi:hypothetical protein
MRFDLSGETQGEWFKFFDSEIKENGEIEYLAPTEDAGKVCIRLANPDFVESIQSQTKKKMAEFAFNPKTRSMERVVYFEQTPAQEKKERELIWDFAIQDWQGVLDKEGNEIPCTLENKLRLMSIPRFARFIGRCIQLISGANAEAEDISVKN